MYVYIYMYTYDVYTTYDSYGRSEGSTVLRRASERVHIRDPGGSVSNSCCRARLAGWPAGDRRAGGAGGQRGKLIFE